MIGALCFYVSHAEKETFQPMRANFGLLPPITPRIRNKGDRKIAYSNRSLKMIKGIYTKEP
jgi:methylenetetrahydrofolate--tRNA-(uracil-5-)-methyltransferase